MSDVVKGVEWAAISHSDNVEAAKKGKGKKGFKGSTANMSLGGGSSKTLNLAVDAAVHAGVHFAVAAGNDNADACNYSPAASKNSLTVGASTLADERAYFSNFGKCVDIFAPGLNILSTWKGGKYATNTISGTSMASPHIAGLLAYFLSLQPSKDSAFAVADITPKQLKEDVLSVATSDSLTDLPKDTPNVRIPFRVEFPTMLMTTRFWPGMAVAHPISLRFWVTRRLSRPRQSPILGMSIVAPLPSRSRLLSTS